MDVRVDLAPGWMWWRPRAVTAADDALVIERRRRAERIPWAEVDAVIDVAPVLIESRGRVVARLPERDGLDALIETIVARAGLEWVERAGRRRGGLPRMAVRPAVAASLRSGHGDRPRSGDASARMSAPPGSSDGGES